MRKRNIICLCILSILCMLLLYFSPDITSMAFVGVMALLLSLAYSVGLSKTIGFTNGFRYAMAKIAGMKEISVEDSWLYIKQIDSLFSFNDLNRMFVKYIRKVEEDKRKDKMILPDIEEYINEDLISLKTQKSFISVVPGTLTGLGVLGTFYGLIGGLGNIRFSSVDVVVDSISLLVSGIDTAFYTSIAGVTLSIVFEIMNKFAWNEMADTMLEFYDVFHNEIIPSKGEQKEGIQLEVYRKILNKADEED